MLKVPKLEQLPILVLSLFSLFVLSPLSFTISFFKLTHLTECVFPCHQYGSFSGEMILRNQGLRLDVLIFTGLLLFLVFSVNKTLS